MSADLTSSGLLCTRGQKDQAKKIVNICGFFSLGRVPSPKVKRKSKDYEQPVLDPQEGSNTAAKKKKIRTTYLDYNYPNTKAALDRAVTAKIRVDASETTLDREVTAKTQRIYQ